MKKAESNLSCPVSFYSENDGVALAVGEGAKASRLFLEQFIYSRFRSQSLSRRSDAAIVSTDSTELAFTTDSFVVDPYLFPGGDIGKMAVCGTLNDLCMVGAVPKWMSLSLMIEEGFPVRDLSTILDSVLEWSDRAHVEVVCGDTKVLPKGKMDGVFINTSAVGIRSIQDHSELPTIREGDIVIVSGPIGCHGMSIMAARTPGLVENAIQSDCGLLLPLVQALEHHQIRVKAMRDATRGGLAAVLHEWSTEHKVAFRLEENLVPVRDDVRGLTELLGIDPLFVANEGTMACVVAPHEVDRALGALRTVEMGRGAAVVGRVTLGNIRKGDLSSVLRSPVTIVRGLGREIPVDEPTGAPLPRIC